MDPIHRNELKQIEYYFYSWSMGKKHGDSWPKYMYRIEIQKSQHAKKAQDINVSYNQIKDVSNVNATIKYVILYHCLVYDEHGLH